MANISWTKAWSSSDDGTIFTGLDLQNIQGDITSVVNGGITNANVASGAAIEEVKLLFDLTTGHNHDGVNSRLVSSKLLNYRSGFTIYGDDDDNICVRAGTIVIDGTVITAVVASGDLAIATSTNWLHGFASPFTGYIYVYLYNSSGSVGYKFSNEAPDLSDADDNIVEEPWRYKKYGATYYRCIGAVYADAAGDLCWGQASSEGLIFTNFDASPIMSICGLANGSNIDIVTLWSPKIVYAALSADASPVTTEDEKQWMATPELLGTVFQAAAVNVEHGITATHEHRLIVNTTAGSINSITAQAAGTAGGFKIYAATDNYVWYAYAMSDMYA